MLSNNGRGTATEIVASVWMEVVLAAMEQEAPLPA
jgi:hypothetical protein